MRGRRIGPVVALSLCIAGGAWAAEQAREETQAERSEAGAAIARVGVQLAAAQAAPKTPDFGGTWGPYRGGRGADPKLAEVAAGAPALKGDYAKRYAERQAAERAATQRGEPLASTSAACMPQGVPTMMRVASDPIEVLQTPKQVTIIGEAFS